MAIQSSYLDKLNPRQREAVTSTEGPLQIIAVAGSGKTTVLVNRVAYLVESGVKPEEILLLTFTKKAASNMLQRAAKLSDERCSEVYAKTFHSFYSDMLHHYGNYIGLPANFIVLTENDEIDRLDYVKAQHTNYKELRGFPTSKDIICMYSSAVNRDIPLSEVIKNQGAEEYEAEICHLKELLSQYKKEKNELSYDDLMLRMYELLQNDEARKRIQNKFRYIMVDEYQDTNALQEKILQLCMNDARNIAVVGDDYQSIYAFRGSKVDLIISFADRVKDCKTVTIDTNYRSTNEILEFANSVMLNKAHFGIDKQMNGTGRHTERVKLIHIETEADEAQDVFNKIIEAHKEGVSYNEIAVLARSSRELNSLDKLLMVNRIPYEKLGGVKFFEHDAVRDMLAYLSCVSRQEDVISWFRILKLLPDIGLKHGQAISSECTDPNFLRNEKYGKKKYVKDLEKLHDLIHNMRSEADFEVIYDMIMDYYVTLRQSIIDNRKVKDESIRTRYQNELNEDIVLCRELKDLALQYQSIPEFLNSLVLDEVSTNQTDTEHVTISTVHSAKGLEWEHVYILNCVNERFPSARTKQGSKEDEEELRCFYVAITRAKSRLYLYAPEMLLNGRSYDPTTLSRYIDASLLYVDEENFDSDNIIHKSTLQFELVPEPLFYKAPRTQMSKSEWDGISASVRKSCTCAICGKKVPIQQLHAHERYSYNDYLHIQRLVDIIPVCELCHNTIHIGYGSTAMPISDLRKHYCDVNGISEGEEQREEKSAFELWENRNNYEWTQEIPESVLDQYRPKLQTNKKFYIQCPYEEKDEAKSLGARWDGAQRSWYYTDPDDAPKFKKWLVLDAVM